MGERASRAQKALGLMWRSRVLLRIEACGEKSQGHWDLPSEPLTLWKGKGEGIFS